MTDQNAEPVPSRIPDPPRVSTHERTPPWKGGPSPDPSQAAGTSQRPTMRARGDPQVRQQLVRCHQRLWFRTTGPAWSWPGRWPLPFEAAQPSVRLSDHVRRDGPPRLSSPGPTRTGATRARSEQPSSGWSPRVAGPPMSRCMRCSRGGRPSSVPTSRRTARRRASPTDGSRFGPTPPRGPPSCGCSPLPCSEDSTRSSATARWYASMWPTRTDHRGARGRGRYETAADLATPTDSR
jgi:hypothetical protein